MKKLNNVLLILLFFPLYASAANYPVYNSFCPKGMYITGYEFKGASKSPKETWGNNNIAQDSIYVNNGCLVFYVGLDNQKSNVDWIKKNHPVAVNKDTVFADIYNNDKTPSKLYFAAIGDITFKSSEGMFRCENVVVGKGSYNKNGISGNWWLYNNSKESGFNKKHTLRCQIVDNGINSGTYVSFSTEIIKKVVVKGGGWGPPTITSNDEMANEKKFGAPTITSEEER